MSEKIIWKPLPDDENKRFNVLWGENSIHRDPIISVPYNILMPKYYEAISDQILNFEVRPDDIWIITYPKCGTTWTQEIVWHIMNDVNKDLGNLPLFVRTPFLEFQGIHSVEYSPANNFRRGSELDEKQATLMKRLCDESVDYTQSLPSPRIIKTHLPFELLPAKIIETSKVIYVCRNPKDTCVSYFFHMTDALANMYRYEGTFDQYIDQFMNGKLKYGNYFHHLKSAWKRRDHPNMKFVWYEDMCKDPRKEVTSLATFINHPLSEEKVAELVDHLKFSNMKERASQESTAPAKLLRKGEVGDWKNYFKGDKTKKWDDWISKNLEGSDIEFKYE